MREQDHYGVLGVPTSATPEQISHAYRALVRRHHPDSRAAPGDGEPDHDGVLQHVMSAYATLHDPVRRAAYDRRRATGATASRPTGYRPTGYDGAGPTGTEIWVGPVRREGDGAQAHPAPDRAAPARLEDLLRALLRGWG